MDDGITDRHGIQYWFVNDKLHREDGPAIIHPDGTQLWYLNDIHHREDGPAIIYSHGEKYWCLKDQEYTFDEYCDELNLSDEDRMILHIKYG